MLRQNCSYRKDTEARKNSEIKEKTRLKFAISQKGK